MRRFKHSLSHYKLLTMSMGTLTPITWFEALPGDSIQQASSALIRCTPLLSPVMHPVRVRIHHWFVPLRLIWNNFTDFITGGQDGDFTAVTPRISFPSVDSGDLADYFGLPSGSYSPDLEVSALPFRAYQMIFNEHYRDQDLIEEIPISKEDGVDDVTSIDMQNVAWEKDYFTTARPWTQKGSEVMVPLGESAPVTGDITVVGAGKPSFSTGNITSVLGGDLQQENVELSTTRQVSGDPELTWQNPALNANLSNAEADLTQAVGLNVNELRVALAIQRYQEARARYGSRYVEYLRYLGVRNPSDARLQEPEYLGGGRQIIQFSEVLQTAQDDIGQEQSPVGTMRGHGISAMRTNRYRRFFEEHGIVMTLMSVIPKTVYMSSIHKSFLRETKEDYYQRELVFLGEQEVKNREIQADHTDPDEVFGYQARYDDYRFIPSTVSAEFRDINNHWHYARDFSGDVALNESFVTAVPTKRVNAEQTTDVLYIMANHSIQARRFLPKYVKPRTF